MIPLIDADILLYRTGHQVEKPIDWGDDLWTLHADFGEAKSRFLSQLERAVPKEAQGDPVLCLSDFDNYRNWLYPEYKGNRTGRKPVVHRALKEWILEGDHGFEVRQRSWLEADDVMGLIQTNSLPGTTVICTIDKDLQQVPGWNYNFDTGVLKDITHTEGHEFFLQQCISGDATDGIPGIRGVGPKKARAHLERFGWDFDSVIQAYEMAGLGVNEALLNAWLVKILTDRLYRGKSVWLQPYERPLAEPMKLREAQEAYPIINPKEEWAHE